MAQIGIFSDFHFSLFLSITSFKIIQIQNVGWVSENSGNLQQDAWDNGTQSWQPQKLKQQKLSQFEPTLKSCFFEDEIFQLFFQSHAPKVPEWKIAHIEWSKKAQNTRKSPKNEWFRGSYVNPPFWEHPVFPWFCNINPQALQEWL